MAQSLLETLVLEPAVGASSTTNLTGFEISVSHRLDDVARIWRALTAETIESPGQQIDFIRFWTDAFRVPEADQFYIVASDEGIPVALIPLQRRKDKGLRVLSWFPGAHVGCDAPIIDRARVAEMSPDRRRRLWLDALEGVDGVDLVYLKSVPRLPVAGVDLFAELGQSVEGDTLYRARFKSFEEADRTQRNKSRRKHDRQQGEKLEAMGTVSFEELGNGEVALDALEVMFRQRGARFGEMGVVDPFSVPAVRAFYDSTVGPGSGVPVKLHVLRLNGGIISMRYSIVHGDRLFCLISSMSEDAALRPGSPGKQCLLRVMQTVFDEGFHVFDMGEGCTDEKRHWCNELVAVRHHYIPVTRRGAIGVWLHRGWQMARRRIKSDPNLLAMAKRVRAAVLRLKGTAVQATTEAPVE